MQQKEVVVINVRIVVKFWGKEGLIVMGYMEWILSGLQNSILCSGQ